ncbi:Rhs_assc_core: RHS repeat-associated core domain, partial [Propionibacterium australiense]
PEPHDPVTTPWSEPAPGAAGGVSSACPDDLRAYSSNVSGANDTVVTQKGTLEGAITDFADKCSWCKINTSGITTALASFETNNTNEVNWVNTVAAAFEAAGGSGEISEVSDAALAACLQAAGVAETRRPLDVQAPSIQGDPQTSGYADDPVNTTTGNFVEPETDLSFSGGAASLVFSRMYNSLSASVGVFGPGWASTADEHLLVDGEGAVWVQASGRHVVFPRLADGWDRADGDSFWLTAVTDTGIAAAEAATTGGDTTAVGGGGFVVSDNQGGRWCFDAAGRPAWVSRGAGTRVEYEWAGGRLVGLWHEWGRSIRLEWNPEGSRVVALVASDGRRVDYTYDESGRLVGATGDGGATRSYAWNEQGLICRVTDADGVVEAENTYNRLGQVVSQRSAFGRVSHYSYLPGGVTQVADADGSRANTWVHDRKGRLVGMIDADGNRQSIGWDRWGNRVQVTGRDGRATICRYDGRGRLATRVEETGARSDYEYDDADRVVRVSVTTSDNQGGPAGDTGDDDQAGPAVTTYEYSGSDRNPSVVTDPGGGVSRLVWDRNLLVGVTDPAGVRVRLGYDEHGDLVSSTNAAGDTARLVRDGAGRVTAAVTPLGYRTEFRYDGAGRLVSRRDPDGATWRFEHTAGGRLTAEVDPDGYRTCYGYGSHGERVERVDALGTCARTVWDDVGNVAEVVLPDGGRWEYAYDGLSRLVATTDPAGGLWRQEYDVNGVVSATTDPTGVRVTQRVSADGTRRSFSDGAAGGGVATDRLGRVVAVTGDDGSDRLVSYDGCGRPVAFTDAVGNVTRLRRDSAGRVVELVRPSGARTSYSYDGCGRLAQVTDPAGGVACFSYDADSRLVGETWPAGERAWYAYDECGRVTARHVPGYGTTRYTYDASGRVVGLQDPMCGRRRFRYDQVGNLVEAVSGTGGVTRYEYDQLGALVAVTDPAGGVTRYERDGHGEVTRLTDPLGRVTTAEYDAAGRQTSQTGADGHRIGWEYDCSGRFVALSYDGVVHHRVERDFEARTMTVTEASGVRHVVCWDANNRLVSRSRGGQAVSWGYDADGRRAWMRSPGGARTGYEYDPAGRLVRVESSVFGTVAYEYDASGQMTAATAGGTRQEWEREGGFITSHLVRQGGVMSHTAVGRDDQGRVAWTSRDGSHTAYAYDEANQLVEARTEDGTARYVWDQAGRLAAETTAGGGDIAYSYDAAGQLTGTSTDGVLSARFSYDAAGQRIREEHADGTVRTYRWDAGGRLEQVTIDSALERSRTSLFTDAMGELAAVDGQGLFWDTATTIPALLSAGGQDVVSVPGFTATVGAGWQTPGWRQAPTTSTTGADVWTTTTAGSPLTAGPGGLSFGAGGEVLLPGGLEALGARVYDPASRGFLTPDPQGPTTGAGWAGNPYSYAANNPVGFTDPTGLHPLSDAEFDQWKDQHKSTLAKAGDWIGDNWEYLAAGAMVVAGVALMFTGVGGAAGLALMSLSGALTSGGISMAQQKHDNGSVDLGTLGKEMAIGAIPIPGGGAAKGAGAIGREAAEGVGREVTETVGREAAEQAASRTGKQELSNIGKNAANDIGDDTARAAHNACNGGNCFVADTPVLMADGTSKPIQDVQAGDEVVAYDPDTDTTQPRTVTRTFVHEQVETLVVRLEDSGSVETTAGHPFLTRDRGWTPAGHLKPGDQLHTPD